MKSTKISFIIFLLALLTGVVNAQEWLWTADISCSDNSQTNVLKSDNSGNLLMFMVFEGDITVGGRTISSLGSKDILLSKFSPDGDTIWNKHIGSAGQDSPRRLTVNDADDIFITGGFAGTTNFDGIILDNTYGSEDIYLVKYTASGNVVWAKRIAWGPNQDRSSGIVLDDAGNIGLVGFFYDSIFFEHDTLVSSGGIDNFFAKFDGDGNFIRAIHYPGTHNQTRINEISLSNDNAFLLSGFFTGTFTAQTEVIVSSGSNDILLIKTDTAGSELWIRTGGGGTADRGFSASSDQYGNVYLTGYISNTATFDSAGFDFRDSSPLVSIGPTDMFLAKYNKNGTLQWKTNNESKGIDQGKGVYVYNNIVQFTGIISDTVIFGVDTLVSKNNSKDAGFFVYNTKGAAIRGVSVQGSLEDGGADVIYDNAGSSYLGGYFISDTLHFLDKQIIKSASGKSNPFMAKYTIPFSTSFTEKETIECNGDTDGKLVVTPYFGAAPFTYQWSHDAGLNDSTALNLGAGTYSVTVTDSRDSTAFSVITLNEPEALSVSSVTDDVSCHSTNGTSNDGSIDLTVTGGTVSGTYSYTWEAISGSGINTSSEDQSTLTMGQYRVTVTDDNACTAIETYVINQPDAIGFAGSVVTDATGGGNDGSIDLNPAGGNGTPYTFSWSNAETTEDISNLYAGNYTVTVTDALSCTDDTTFLVGDATAFLAFITNKTDVSCKGDATGSATVDVSGGTGPYDYAWENSVGTSVGGNNATLSGVTAGIYYVTVTDNFDLRTAEAFTQINEPSQELSTFITSTNIDCYGDNTGSADLTVTGGTLPLTFLWSNGTETEDLVNVGANTYSVLVTDAKDCEISDEVIITEPEAMDITITIDQVIFCNGDLSGILNANATGGTGTKSYVWNDPGNQTVKRATNLGAGYYTVTATDINECTVMESIQLTQPAKLVLSKTHQHVSCNGAGDGLINLSVNGGTPTFNYDWSNGAITQDISDLEPGIYSVTVTDANACDAFLQDTITEPAPLSILSQEVDGSTITIVAEGGTLPYSYTLDGSTENSTGIFTDVEAGIHSVEVTDANDCGPIIINDLEVIDAIEDLLLNNLNIYPNPSDGLFYFDFNSFSESEYRIQVYSMTGSLITDQVLYMGTGTQHKFAIDLSEAESGAYIVKINGIALDRKLVVK